MYVEKVCMHGRGGSKREVEEVWKGGADGIEVWMGSRGGGKVEEGRVWRARERCGWWMGRDRGLRLV